jgi:hypothetical protein
LSSDDREEQKIDDSDKNNENNVVEPFRKFNPFPDKLMVRNSSEIDMFTQGRKFTTDDQQRIAN